MSYSQRMEFNPTDKSKSIIADIDFLLFGSSTVFNPTYSLIDRTRNINLALDEVVAELHKADPNYMWDDFTNPNFPIAYLDLSSSDHFTLVDSSMVIHRLRVKDKNGKWKTLTPKSRRELTDEELDSTGTPEYYYKIDNAVFPIPVPDYASGSGIELQFQRGANHFSSSDTNKKPGFNSLFHRFLSIDASLSYAVANGLSKKINVLSAKKEQVRTAIREHYERRSPDERPKLRLRRGNPRRYGL